MKKFINFLKDLRKIVRETRGLVKEIKLLILAVMGIPTLLFWAYKNWEPIFNWLTQVL